MADLSQSMADDRPPLYAASSRRGRLALALASAHRRAQGMPYTAWYALPNSEREAFWTAAGALLPTILEDEVKRLHDLADGVAATLEDLGAEDTESLPAAIRAVLS